MNRKLLGASATLAIIILIVVLMLPTPHRVARVIDGDTLVLENGERVRLLGIDTPERGEFLYLEAKELLSNLTAGRTVFLQTGREDRDKYGRQLRWIISDGGLANLDLVESGLARTFMLEENDRYYQELTEAEAAAREMGLGIWAESLNSSYP